MKFVDALQSGQPLTRRDKTWTYLYSGSYLALTNHTTIAPNTFIDSDFLIKHIRLDREDILADDWIVMDSLSDKDYETVE
jgi:hypothetical protein